MGREKRSQARRHGESKRNGGKAESAGSCECCARPRRCDQGVWRLPMIRDRKKNKTAQKESWIYAEGVEG